MTRATEATGNNGIKHVGIIFSGGPAPGANAVIAAAATAFVRAGVRVTGFYHGYQFLENYGANGPLVEGEHYINLTAKAVSGIRHSQGIILHNSRANPGKPIRSWADLGDPERNGKMLNIFKAFDDLEIDGLISIGGDDTLKTANYVHRIQQEVSGLRPVHVVHVPKTIDNDYHGIDWTFGFFSAAECAGNNIRNLLADSYTSGNWFVVELMGRKAGWLTYAAAMIGDATRVISVEDLPEGDLDLDALAAELSSLIAARKEAGEDYGVICVAEGLADRLPAEVKGSGEVDLHGNVVLTSVGIGKMLSDRIMAVHKESRGEKIKVIPHQVGYETRCAAPAGFDVILSSQLGFGACRALVEEGKAGVMVSVGEQLSLRYVPFSELIDEETGLTRLKFIEDDSDFQRLGRLLEDNR